MRESVLLPLPEAPDDEARLALRHVPLARSRTVRPNSRAAARELSKGSPAAHATQ
jgi:hypothetical protein